MRFLVIIYILTFQLNAQNRVNSPLPKVSEEPYWSVSEGIVGWSKSKDGQWLSKENTLPAIGISRDKDFYQQKQNKLGVDNITELKSFLVSYGSDSLVAIVKSYRSGSYKYPLTQKRWQEQLNAHYCIVPLKYLRMAINSVGDDKVHLLKIEAYGCETLYDIKERQVRRKLSENILVDKNCDQHLVIHYQHLKTERKLRFLIFSMHRLFPEVEGTLNDLKMRGKSLYGSEQALEYAYFEIEDTLFKGLIKPK